MYRTCGGAAENSGAYCGWERPIDGGYTVRADLRGAAVISFVAIVVGVCTAAAPIVGASSVATQARLELSTPPALDASITVAASVFSIDGAPGSGWYGGRQGANTVLRYDDVGQVVSSFPASVGGIVSQYGGDVAVGPDGDLYVAAQTTPTPAPNGDPESRGVIRRYSDGGTLELEHNSQAGFFHGLDVGADGQVYAVENSRLVCAVYDDDDCVSYATRGADALWRFADGGGVPTPLGTGTTLNDPADVAVHGGLVHVADKGNNRVVTFTTAGVLVRTLPIAKPVSVATDATGTLYVASEEGRLLQAYAADGALRSSWQYPDAFIPWRLRLAVDAKGRLLVLDPSGPKVHRYAATTAVAGTVTSSGGGPVEDAWVAVLRQSDFSVAGTAATASDGSYSAAVAPGSYFVYLLDPSGGHAAGFAGGNSPSPTVVTAFGPQTVDGVMTAQRGSVVGAVTETGSGTPLPNGEVVVMSASGFAERTAAVDADGEFEVAGLTPGHRLVAHFDRSGAHAPRFFDGALNALVATQVPVVAGGDATANGSLPVQTAPGTGAALSGVVTETGSGDPVADATVLALRSSDFGFVRAAHTDDNGAYSLDVPAGSYLVGFLSSSGRHLVEWHDDQPSHALGSATPVTAPTVVNAGLAPTTGAVGGTVTDETSGDPIANVWVLAIGPSGLAGGSVTDGDGNYSIDGLAPGTYRVTFADVVGGRAQEFWPNAPDYSGATPLAVSAGADLDVDGVLG